jgi:hypothetical protein
MFSIERKVPFIVLLKSKGGFVESLLFRMTILAGLASKLFAVSHSMARGAIFEIGFVNGIASIFFVVAALARNRFMVAV